MAKKVKFKKWKCIVEKKQYENGRIALSLRDEETNEPVAVASVNIDEYQMTDSLVKEHTFIKNWSENEGVLECLIAAGIVENTGLEWHAGFVKAYLVKVLI